MPITLTAAYVSELKKGSNHPNVIIEMTLDNITYKFGQNTGGFNDVQPILTDISSLQNKIDTKAGYTTRGKMTFSIAGRDIIKRLIGNRFLKNRRIVRKEGFLVSGFTYSDYAETFTGKITDWSRNGDELDISVADDMTEGLKKIPVENSRKTQFLDYRNTNPVNIIHDMLSSRMNISTVYIDSTKFATERDTWLNTLIFNRVITKPEDADKYLNELQVETNSFLIHDGNKISYKVFAPVIPGQSVQSWNDNFNILEDSVSQDSGYKENFANRVIVMYDYDESGSDGWENYESVYITQDSSSLSTSEWNETATKEIKSKWIRSRTYTQPTNITGVNLFHVSYDNSTGPGTLTYATGSTANTLSWTAPNSTAAGELVKLNKAGVFQLFDSDTSKSVRVIVESSSLPLGSTSDSISITALNGGAYAQTLANRHLARYRNPVASISFEVDLNDAAFNSQFLKPTDIKYITTDEAFDKDSTGWSSESVMLTSVRPDLEKHILSVEAIQTNLYRKYGFIAPAGYPTYSSVTEAQKEYAFIADTSGMLAGSTALAYYIWGFALCAFNLFEMVFIFGDTWH